MFVWQNKPMLKYAPAATADLTAVFTEQELERLRALRARSCALQVSEEYGVDVRRLQFARWLVTHGRLHED